MLCCHRPDELIVSYGGPIGRQHYLTSTSVEDEQRLRRFTPHDELDKWKNTDWNRADRGGHKERRLYEAATLNETYPRRKPLNPQCWWKLDPPAPGKAQKGS